MKSSDKGKGLTRRDMLGRTTVIAAAGVTGLAGGVELAEVAGGADAQTPSHSGGAASPHAKSEVAPSAART